MKKKVILVLSILFGLMFINSGLNKLFHYLPMPSDMPENMIKLTNAMMEIGWLMPLVAVVEIIGGLLFITNKFRALGAIIIFPVLVGILLTHTVTEPSGLPMVLIFLAIELWIIFENRDKFLHLIK